MKLKEKLLDKTEETIKKYNMLHIDKPAPVAFSCGKDFATAIFLLDELGYDVKPVIVDRGDDPLFNANEIKSNLRNFDYEANILNLRNYNFLENICSSAGSEIKRYIEQFDNLPKDASHCTPCYNARTLALTEYTLHMGSDSFVIGQHKTDMVTSLLKCYWTEKYWQEFTRQKGIPYDGFRMKEFIESSEIDLEYLDFMVENERAATDDPPVEKINEKVKLVRPLCEISEREIELFIKEIGSPYTSGNCSYRETEPRSFRLIVQFDLRRRLENNPELEDILFEFVLRGLNDDGTLKFRPRNKRDIYWPGFKPYIRKL